MLNGDSKLDLKSKSGRRAISSVISAIMLSAVVLAVGGSLWAFSQGAMTISSEDYAESVINMTDTISERFIIEHVYYDDPYLHIFVYNYGTVDIKVKIEVKGETCLGAGETWLEITSKEMKPYSPIVVLQPSPSPKEELNIKAYTKRGNNAYYKFIVP